MDDSVLKLYTKKHKEVEEIDFRKLYLEKMIRDVLKYRVKYIRVYKGYLISGYHTKEEVIDLYDDFGKLGYSREEVVQEVIDFKKEKEEEAK